MFRKTFGIDFQELPEFNPAIIYTFEHEDCQTEDMDIDYPLSAYGQRKDMFEAYRYAQEVLSFIRQHGLQAITPELFLSWLDQIHARIAKTLAHFLEQKAGIYASDQVLRWTHHTNAMNLWVAYALKILPQKQLIKQLKAIDCRETISLPFIKLLENMAHYKKPNHETLLHTLIERFHQGHFTEDEKATIKQIVTICLPPEKLKHAMQQFATEFIPKWQACDKNDLEQIGTLIHGIFVGIAGIHPYFNANGRTAACFSNIILRSLDQPSILIREPAEKNNQASLYSQAIKHIDDQPALFIYLIKKRIQEATKNGPFQHPLMKTLFEHRMDSSLLVAEMHFHDPQHSFLAELTQAIDGLTSDVQKDSSIHLNTLEGDIVVSKRYYETTKNTVYKNFMKQFLRKTLEEHTKYSWKPYYAKEQIIALCAGLDETTAQDLVDTLREIKGIIASLMRTQKDDKPIVQVVLADSLDLVLSLKQHIKPVLFEKQPKKTIRLIQ